MKTALELLADERKRQIEVEGWAPERDDQYTYGSLAKAAACYSTPEMSRIVMSVDSKNPDYTPRHWPFSDEWWKPTPENRIRELVKAGALIVAEIERLQRLEARNE